MNLEISASAVHNFIKTFGKSRETSVSKANNKYLIVVIVDP